MRIGRIRAGDGAQHIVVATDANDEPRLVDVTAAAKAFGDKTVPATLAEVIAKGTPALDAVRAVVERALAGGGEELLLETADAAWMTPTDPAVCLCAGRNFSKHRDESLGFWSKEKRADGIHFNFPCGFMKSPHLLVPHGAEVAKPDGVEEFDYEVEIAAVIGRPITGISEEKALDAVFGYTIFNDLSARELQRDEMRNQMIMLGKNMPGFGPVGPMILTADEVPDPQALTVALHVNGETRQSDPAADMIFGFAALISFWSRMGLAPGDLVTSGTPEGVAMHHKPDPFAWYLKPGDVVDASVSGIGTLRTRIAS